ncbi:Tetraspanin family-domain-containing protein [Coemansia spiralis]|nr:Tetraspanin family-domain-containing protein [Coemansia spiralis]
MLRAVEVSSDSPMRLKLSVKIGFGLVTACYMATGIAALAVAGYFISAKSSPKREIIVTKNVLKSLFAAGAYIIAVSLVGIVGAMSPLSRKRWLLAYNWLLSTTILLETGVGLWMWARTLDINGLYAFNWRNLWSSDVKQSFQDAYQCCGYLSSKDSPVLSSASCKNPDASSYGCMVFVHDYARGSLSYIYTCVFAFVLVDVVAMLAGLIVLTIRNDEERWRWSRANSIFKSMKKANPDFMMDANNEKYSTLSAMPTSSIYFSPQ